MCHTVLHFLPTNGAKIVAVGVCTTWVLCVCFFSGSFRHFFFFDGYLFLTSGALLLPLVYSKVCLCVCVLFFLVVSCPASFFFSVSREPFFFFLILLAKFPHRAHPDSLPVFVFVPFLQTSPSPMTTQHVIRLAHVPPPPPTNANNKVENPRSTCVLLSGGHGGLVRCSAVPAHVPVIRTGYSSPARRSNVSAKVAPKTSKVSPKVAAAEAMVGKVSGRTGGKAAVADSTGSSAAPDEARGASKAVPPSWEKALTASTAAAAAAAAAGGVAGAVAGAGAAGVSVVPAVSGGRGGGSAAAKRGRTPRSKAKNGVVGDAVAGKRTRSSR